MLLDRFEQLDPDHRGLAAVIHHERDAQVPIDALDAVAQVQLDPHALAANLGGQYLALLVEELLHQVQLQVVEERSPVRREFFEVLVRFKLRFGGLRGICG